MSCCAVNCKNRASKGFRLARFPTDPKRRKIWIERCGRENWEPSDWSKLCEVHFDSDQWENHREDGRRKLKPNALPLPCYEETEAEGNIENIIIYDATDESNSNEIIEEIVLRPEEKRTDSEIDRLTAQNEKLRLLVKNYSTVLMASLPEEKDEDRTIDVLKSENIQMHLLLGACSSIDKLDKRIESVKDIVSAYIFKIKREIQDDVKFLNTDYGHLREIMRLVMEFVNTIPKSSSSDVVELTAVMKEMYGVMSVIVPENSKVKSLLKKFILFLDKNITPKTEVSVVSDIATNVHKTVRPDPEMDLWKTEIEYSELVEKDLFGSPSYVVSEEEIEYSDLIEKVRDDIDVFRRLSTGLKQASKELTAFLQAHKAH